MSSLAPPVRVVDWCRKNAQHRIQFPRRLLLVTKVPVRLIVMRWWRSAMCPATLAIRRRGPLEPDRGIGASRRYSDHHLRQAALCSHSSKTALPTMISGLKKLKPRDCCFIHGHGLRRGAPGLRSGRAKQAHGKVGCSPPCSDNGTPI